MKKHSTVIICHTYKFVPRYSFLKFAIICPPDFDQFISSYEQEKRQTVNNMTSSKQRFNWIYNIETSKELFLSKLPAPATQMS